MDRLEGMFVRLSAISVMHPEAQSPLRTIIGLASQLNLTCFLSTIFISCIVIGCTSSGQLPKYGEGSFSISGTMQLTNVERGCWQFMTADGESYELMGTDLTPLLHDKLQAELVVREVPDMMSICMIGKVVEVLHIVHTSQ